MNVYKTCHEHVMFWLRSSYLTNHTDSIIIIFHKAYEKNFLQFSLSKGTHSGFSGPRQLQHSYLHQ